MLNSEVLDNMMRRYGNRRAPGLRTTTLFELNEKIRQLENGDIIPWFLEQRWEATSVPPAVTVANQDYVTLPTNFVREYEEGKLRILNINVSPNTWSPLVKVSFEMLRDETENATAGLPQGYAIFGNRIYFGPTPDQIYSLRLPYYARTAAIADNGDEATSPWIIEYFNFITLDTIDLVARTHLRDSSLVQSISAELQQAADLFWRSVEGREHANRDYLLDNSES